MKLFEARMRDLDQITNLSSMKKSLLHFKSYILNFSRHGKLNLENMQLGLNSASYIAHMIGRSTH